MKRLLILFSLSLPMVTGCAGCQNSMKHLQSDILGLNRKITIYSANGDVVREWSTKAKVEDRGGSCYFLDDDGKAVIVSGSFVIEEK